MSRPRYRLFDDVTQSRLGLVADVRGFFEGDESVDCWSADRDGEMPSTDFEVLGLVPDPPLRAALETAGDAECELEEISLQVLSDDGEPIGLYPLLCAELARTGSSVDGSIDARVVAWIPGSAPRVEVERVWDAWRSGPPDRYGVWAELPAGPRAAWLRVVADYRPNDPLRRREHARGPSGRPEVVLDGGHITDFTGFLCAIGEAVNGPGGYFGSNPMALADCVSSGWGVACPFTLVWENADVARARLGDTMDMLLDIFREAGTDVVLR